jgi:hypothetical protein
VAFGAFVVTAVWVIDSGASHHMCNARSSFVEFKKLHTPIRIRLGDDSTVCATHHGLVNITPSFQVYALYTYVQVLASVNQQSR